MRQLLQSLQSHTLHKSFRGNSPLEVFTKDLKWKSRASKKRFSFFLMEILT